MVDPSTGEVFRGRCITCKAHDDEPARDGCGHPRWHIPNANAPHKELEPKREVRLPYAED